MRYQSNFGHSINFVKIQSEEDFDDFRYAGKITAECLSMLEYLISTKTTKTLTQLDIIAEEFFISNNTKPVFKGYHGFPASVCMSIDNDNVHQLVHGIPTDYQLQEGDLITFDTGCDYNGALSDSAITCIYGQPKSAHSEALVSATQECLYAGIRAISKNRVGAIGNAIYHTARKKGFKVIENYTGHGISKNEIHASPIIPNKSDIESGVRFGTGMVIAIEPLLTTGSIETKIDKDNWTVVTQNTNAHFEHSILILEDKVEILTLRGNENFKA